MQTTARRRIVVQIQGVTEPATFPSLDAAIEAAWTSLRALPLGSHQYEAYREFFGPGVAVRVAEFLERDGELSLTFSLPDGRHVVHFRPARDGR